MSDLAVVGATPLTFEDPRQIGAFPLLGVLGSGGMGRVYLAATPRGYGAVKRVLPEAVDNPRFLERFSQELDNQARVPTGVSAKVLASDSTAEPPWFATQYVPGVTLHDAIHIEGGLLPTPTLWRLLHEVAVRLSSVHKLGITHRDLKPSNVILVDDGLRLIDFGIARAADQPALTGDSASPGTPGYMAPEMFRPGPGPTTAVDVFALAATIVSAATGLPPTGESCRLIEDAALADILESCLATDPGQRPTASALSNQATHILGTLPAAAAMWPNRTMAQIYLRKAFAESFRPLEHGPTVDEPPEAQARPRKRRRRGLFVIPLAALLTVGTGAATYLLTQPTQPTNVPARGDSVAGGQVPGALGTSTATPLGRQSGASAHPSTSANATATASASKLNQPGNPTSNPVASPASPPRVAHTTTATGTGTPAPIVDASPAMMLTPAFGECLDGGAAWSDSSIDACTSGPDQEWHTSTGSGVFAMETGSGCLFDDYGFIRVEPCQPNASGELWQLASGGRLEQAGTGQCLTAYSQYFGLDLTSCGSGGSSQVWLRKN